MDNSVDNRIKEVMASVFDISKEDVKDDTSPDTIELWDSLKHMNLIVALEEEFEIEFSDDDISNIMNYQLIKISVVDGLSWKLYENIMTSSKLNKTFHDKKVIITGHTGFKGSWLTLWLSSLGAKVYGISLNIPTKPSNFETLKLHKKYN